MIMKLRLIYIYTIFFCTLGQIVVAQQWPQYLLSSFTMAEVNPAATGLSNKLSFGTGLRRQWNNLPGSPNGYQAIVQMPIPMIASGAGLHVSQDRIGLLNTLEISGLYAYHLEIGSRTKLSGGLAFGIMQSGLNGNEIRTPGGSYPGTVPDHQDGILPTGNVSGSIPILHGGIMISNHRYALGASMRYVQGGKLNLRGSDVASGISIKPHYNISGQYNFTVGDITWIPNLAFRTDLLYMQGEALVFAKWRERFLIGGGYRGWQSENRDAWMISAGLKISDRLLLIYAYEGGVSPLRSANNGSFELMLRYDLDIFANRGILPPQTYNPRFL
jgi:type IX secretion system PorP/SprF family membrane protein